LHGHLAQHRRSSEPKCHIPTPRGTWGNFGETRGGVGKNGALDSGLWSTKAAISLKRVQIEEMLLWGTYRNSPSLFRTVPSRPLGPPLPQDWGFAPHPKLQSLLSQERVKLRTSNLARTITGSIRIIAHEKFRRKGSVGVSRDCPIFWVPLLSQEWGKLEISNLASTFRGSIRTKAH